MGKITVCPPQKRRTYVARESTDPGVHRASLSEGELDSKVASWFPIADESLQLFEVRFGPDVTITPHAHTEPEIILVTEGELRFGSQLAAPGTAIYIDADTLYGFRTGPLGCAFLNFRGVPRAGYIAREDFAERRRDRQGESQG